MLSRRSFLALSAIGCGEDVRMITADPATLPVGRLPGVAAFYGDSLSAEDSSQSSLLRDIANYYKFLSVPMKQATAPGIAVFGWKADPNGIAAGNLANFNALKDASAPWNVALVWMGSNDIAAGDTAASVYGSLQAIDAALAPIWPARFYSTMLARSLAAGPAAERLALNAALVSTPIGTGTIDVSGFPGTPGAAPWYVDLIHATTQGQGWLAANCWDGPLRAYLDTL